ncbi:MAG: hypothetical protein ISS41_03025 [Candidatus Aminicenantes bacterium]|nr:hypothetical protein [Candidatus Aminicenantes bacterium]
MKKGNKIVISLIAIIFLCLPCFGQEKKPKEQSKIESKFTSLQKSLLIPGWGQFAEKRYLEGALFLSAEIFCIYKIFLNNHKSNDYYDLYKTADNTTDAVNYRNLTEKYDIRRNKFLLAAAGIWIINLIDIYIIVKKKEKKSGNLKLKLEHNENKTLFFTISYSF